MTGCCKGSWIDCINPFSNPVKCGYFRHIPSCTHHYKNDSSKICPVCWGAAEIRNHSLYRTSTSNNTYAQISHSAKCTPEADSL